MGYYKLGPNHEIIPVYDVLEWGEWFESMDNRRVAETDVAGFHVSTVFLGLDHGLLDDARAVLFETMVFDGDWSDVRCERCCTWAEAERQHARLVREIETAGKLAAKHAGAAKPTPEPKP